MQELDEINSVTISPAIEPPIICSHVPDDHEKTIDKHIIIFHGWNSTSSAMNNMKSAIQNVKGANKRYIWLVNFETHRTGFDTAAQFLKHELDKQPHQFQDVIYFGYSLGGLVARQLIAEGMQCTALIALCSPHNGILSYIPQIPWDKSERSMRKNSTELNALNNNVRDKAHHSRYYFFGIGYFNHKKERVRNDKLIALDSAQGKNLRGIHYKLSIYIKKDYNALDFHHMKGMDPHYCQDVLTTLGTILRHADV